MWNLAQKLQEKITQESQCDPLTQLPNAGEFLQIIDKNIQKNSDVNSDSERFTHTLSSYMTKNHGTSNNMAVILLDIDNFKEINSTLGSHSGDELLKVIADRLKKAFANCKVVVARVGGDDFALLIENGNESAAFKKVGQVRALFDQPFNLNSVSIVLEISVGISVYPQHGDTASELLKDAEIAM